MYFVYLLYSEKCDRYNIGYAADLKSRLDRHNNGFVTATKNCKPYQLMASNLLNQKQKQEKKKPESKNKKAGNILNGLLMETGRHAPIINGVASDGRTPIHIEVQDFYKATIVAFFV